MKTTPEPATAAANPPLADIIQAACQRIPPLWSLKNFVAVNPFVGMSNRHFAEAARLMPRVGHGDMLMPAEYYREQIATGRIQEADFQAARRLAAQNLPTGWAQPIDFPNLTALNNALASAKPDQQGRVLTFADFLDTQSASSWAAFVVEEISKWCSAYFDQGQSSWRMPWRHLGLLAAWRAAARLDVNPELTGLKGFRELVAALPNDPIEVTSRVLEQLGVPETSRADFLHRQLLSLPGWSSYVQYQVREKGMAGQDDDSLTELLAIRLAYDLALWRQFGGTEAISQNWQLQLARLPDADATIPPELLARYTAQLALECGYQNQLITQLKASRPETVAAGSKTLQAIFCIDVRSEVFRRALEAQSGEIETIGFAGFFGMAFEYLKFGRENGGAQCPVLLSPKLKVREVLQAAAPDAELRLLRQMDFRRTVDGAWNSFKTSAISCFSFVETAGLWSGVKLVGDALAWPAPNPSAAAGRQRFGPKLEREAGGSKEAGHACETGIGLADQISLAAGALKNMGLTANFARVVLICGHGSATVNNPYGSALDCGACGGHSGEANARVAAAILNQPAVRAGLLEHGIQIPADTLFVAGLHNTTTDEVTIYDADSFSASRPLEFAQLRHWLAGAAKLARRERAPALGLADLPEGEREASILARSRDWAEVRPEWGLAGNAAFIAAPRVRTKGLNLGGRVFLHNYDASQDRDQSTLELILCAPMVVASWINLQYYGSTVNNRLFGSGNKVLHNVVGTFGVWQGNGGDLQPGLPLQSVHDGEKWMHEPLRLNVFIEAAPDAIESALAKHPGVRELVANGWVQLFAMDAAGRFWRHGRTGFAEVAA